MAGWSSSRVPHSRRSARRPVHRGTRSGKNAGRPATIHLARPAGADPVAAPETARRPSTRLSFGFAALGGLWLLLFELGAFGGFESYAFAVIAIGTLAAVVSGVLIWKPDVKWPWLLVCVALFLFVIGGVLRTDLHTLGNLTASRSLVPDIVTLPGYGLLAIGLLGFYRFRAGERYRLDSALDGLMIGLAALALSWVFVADPVLANHHTPLPVQIVLICYPALSCFLVVAILRVAFGPGEQRVLAFRFLVVAWACMLVGDTIYMLVDANLIHVASPLLELPYGFAYIAAGTAALHPSMRVGTQSSDEKRPTSHRTRIILVALALMVPAVVILARHNVPDSDRLTLALVVVALTATAILRIVQALRWADRSESLLTHQATHDSLTGLPNRRLMENQLSRALERTLATGTDVALLFLDLDQFKVVNDTLGHSHGDELLVMLAKRLRQNVRPTDTVTRVGGDEFVIVLGNVSGVDQARELAERLRQCLHTPFVVDGSEFHLSASIGVAFADRDNAVANAEMLLREADTAMYQAKDAGRDTVAVFDGWMRTRIAERLDLENHLRHAVERKELYLVFQPIVRLPDGSVEGVEALVRWRHPTFGTLLPARFVPLAEERGLIGEIGSFVLDEALKQVARWCRREVAGSDFYVAVNLSASQLYDDGMVEHVRQSVASSGLPPESLYLELTESVMMDDPSRAANILKKLRENGVRLAIDDFGTEYSSLAYLKRFPVHRLKIDRSFVDSLAEADNAETSLVAAMVAMARALGISTVGEGVEVAAQARSLFELGCDSAQGYLYGRPVKASQLPGLLSSLAARIEPAAVTHG